MEKFWRAALAVAGLGAVGSFVFWSLYSQWLSLKIFASLTSDQTFELMLVFLVLTFVAAIATLITYVLRTSSSPVGTVGNSYSIPAGATFQVIIEKIASGKNVEFQNFSKNELAASLKSKEFSAANDIEAIKQIRLLTGNKVRPYSVESSTVGPIVLKVK